MAALVALFFYGCRGTGGRGSDVGDGGFLVDSVGVCDSVTVGKCHASVVINGTYPADGASELIDSVRMWLGLQLSNVAGYDGSELFAVTPGLVADGRKLIKTCCDSLMAGAGRDFADFSGEDWSVNYEYDVRFGVSSISENLLSYDFVAYGYQGGAHGGTSAVSATFNRSDGSVLTYDRVFLPEKRAELIDMIRTELWNRYFKDLDAGDTLADALLVNPDELELPSTLPDFKPEGVQFTYQQYEIAPYVYGMPSCTIAYDELRPLMRPEVLDLIP